MPLQQEFLADDIQSAVHRITSSPQFVHAESLIRLLRYVVDRTLAGEGEFLKEYTLGVEVFHRGANFDPRHDTIVRVQARTLRSRLASYYANGGQGELVRIELAKGGYIPTFRRAHSQKEVVREQIRRGPLRPYVLALAAILTLVVVAAVSLRLTKASAMRSLAILPLENLSGDPEQEYLSDGITEAITTELGRVHDLRVTSRTSAMQYKPARRDLRKIARELNVNYVLEGAVARSAQHVRVTAQLIEAASDRHIWSESYELDMGDVVLVEGKIARAVSREIQIQLNPDIAKILARERRVAPEAYVAYLKARYLQNEMTEEALHRSIRFFEEAIGLKPDYAGAYAGLADSYAALSTTYVPPREVMPRAIAAADKAIQLDDTIAEAHVARGRLALLYEWDWPSAKAHFQRALEINPSLAPAHTWYASYLGRMRSFDESLSETKQAQALDPVSLAATLDLSWNYLEAHRFDLLTSHTRKVLEIDPTFAWAHAFLGWAAARNGVAEEGLQHATKAAQIDDSPVIQGFLGEVHAMAGRREAAERVLGELRKTATRRYVCAHEIGTLQAALQQRDQAVDSLEQAYQARSECMAFLTVDPRVESLRSNRRFQRLLARIESRH